ncbi:hypothetical protein KMZ93_02670 [Bradyrhizobium sediminis]|uniref:Uncharacterized protein n=1 Tax=Bradyrhizobium sediminis TaxID=2840469 RepID=A0A975RXK5_9BRAD|nr:hypothetical protein [Bradyrhizobium sediminis]QWG23865.1 hypothetical protein KMZ93_02670 [Bradyrhizobium sediminis]
MESCDAFSCFGYLARVAGRTLSLKPFAGNAELETLRLRRRPLGDISDGKLIPASMMYAKG